MPVESPAQKQSATGLPKSFETFEFQSIEHLRTLHYERRSSVEGARRAFRFFETNAPYDNSFDDDLDDHEDGMGKEPETEPGSDNETSAPTEGGKENGTMHVQQDIATDNRRSNAQDVVGAETSQSNARADGPADSAALAKCKEKLAAANAQLALAQQRLAMMHKQAMHCSQELKSASGAFKKVKELQSWEGFHGGTHACLVHCGSTPFIQARLSYREPFDATPKILVGIQTSDPSAMALVFATDVDTQGFTVYADLANDVDFDKADLIKCLITWVAVENCPPQRTNQNQGIHHTRFNHNKHPSDNSYDNELQSHKRARYSHGL